ncbi:NIPSNAP family protein (plasmid) [Cedecea neteri]|uniref:NIPSNAP family protein n=1 Tax=Cedecea neteri TaxID=158822 RepID=UPI0028937FD0|nr:NIPSNAP family protein [Cedecea neteri]WNJ82181.1 NIPSNAP family protein [Cedecea neteri]WPU21914.1 NIPSNAP family protein [Cedecea neteri]
MIYELREYTAVPGKMAAMVKRFNEESLRLFKKHGMEVVFLSLTTFGPDTVNELVYVLKFDSEQDMATKWQAFYSDTEWHNVRDTSEIDGPLVVSVSRRVLSPDVFAI